MKQWHCVRIAVLLLVFLTGIPINKSSFAGENLSDLQKANKIFNWLEYEFPEILSPTPQPTYESDGIYFRYYPGTNVYIGTIQNDLYFYDHLGVLYNLGSVDIWLPHARYAKMQSAEKIHLGQIPVIKHGVIERGGSAWYAAQVDSGIHISAYAAITSTDIHIKIYSPDGNLLVENNIYTSFTGATTQQSGTHYFSLTAFDGSRASYSIGFDALSLPSPFPNFPY